MGRPKKSDAPKLAVVLNFEVVPIAKVHTRTYAGDFRYFPIMRTLQDMDTNKAMRLTIGPDRDGQKQLMAAVSRWFGRGVFLLARQNENEVAIFRNPKQTKVES